MHLSLTIVTFTEMCTSPPRSLEKKQKKKERKKILHAYDKLSHCKNQREHKSRVLGSSYTKTFMGTCKHSNKRTGLTASPHQRNAFEYKLSSCLNL